MKNLCFVQSSVERYFQNNANKGYKENPALDFGQDLWYLGQSFNLDYPLNTCNTIIWTVSKMLFKGIGEMG